MSIVTIIIEELFFIKYCNTTAVSLFTINERRQLGQFLLRLNVTFYTKIGNRPDTVGLHSSL